MIHPLCQPSVDRRGASELLLLHEQRPVEHFNLSTQRFVRSVLFPFTSNIRHHRHFHYHHTPICIENRKLEQ